MSADGKMTGLVSEHDLTQLGATGLHELRAGIETSLSVAEKRHTPLG